MKIGIIILARMGSTRLPGKVLMTLAGKPVLEHMIHRLSKVDAGPTIVATSVHHNNDPIEKLCRRLDVPCFRGSEENVLERSIQASQAFGLDAHVRLGGDSPLLDWEVINRMLALFRNEAEEGRPLDYISNSLARSFPLGVDAEIITTNTLMRIDRETQNLSAEERLLNEANVVPYLHENLHRFTVYSYEEPYDYSYLRWTLDTPEDFALIEAIYLALYPKNPDFRMPDILAFLEENPSLKKINAKIVPRTGYWTPGEREKLQRRFGEKVEGSTPDSLRTGHRVVTPNKRSSEET